MIRHHNNENDRTPLNFSNVNLFLGFSPTMRRGWQDENDRVVDLHHTRAKSRTYCNGYSETITLMVEAPVLWRRIVFWSYAQAGALEGPRSTGGGSLIPYYTRQGVPINNSQELRDWLFLGTEDRDYERPQMINAPLNVSNMKLVMDKKRTLNPYDSDLGRMYTFKHFYRGGRIWYNDLETGSKDNFSPFSTLSRQSVGNLYIFDMFSQTVTGNSNAGWISCQGKYYWSED